MIKWLTTGQPICLGIYMCFYAYTFFYYIYEQTGTTHALNKGYKERHGSESNTEWRIKWLISSSAEMYVYLYLSIYVHINVFMYGGVVRSTGSTHALNRDTNVITGTADIYIHLYICLIIPYLNVFIYMLRQSEWNQSCRAQHGNHACPKNQTKIGLKVLCTSKWFDFEIPLIKTTKLLVETRSCTWAKRI